VHLSRSEPAPPDRGNLYVPDEADAAERGGGTTRARTWAARAALAAAVSAAAYAAGTAVRRAA
jgi:hypothetical protein